MSSWLHPAGAPEAPVRQAPVASVLPHPRLAFFGELVGRMPVRRPLTALECGLLRHVDTVAACDAARAGLLPGAADAVAAVVRALREPDGPLVVPAPQPLATARRALAARRLAPLFDAPAGSLAGRAAGRLRPHAEAVAAGTEALAAAAGLDPVDGFLAGLLHGLGWRALLGALDGAPGGLPPEFTETFALELEPRREALFALLAMTWPLGDPLTALAIELLGDRLEDARSPLAGALRTADRNAAFRMIGAGALCDPLGG